MKLKEAVEIGIECGLETLEEAINNIVIHSLNLFSYIDFNKEVNELIGEVAKLGYLDKLDTKLDDLVEK